MSTYESGYDPELGYNKNAFQEEGRPLQLVILGKTVKLIAGSIGLVSEAIHNRRDSKSAKSAKGVPDADEGAESKDTTDAVYVNLPPEQADALIASGEAVAAEDKTPTHELVPADEPHSDVDEDEADWALDDATEDVEQQADLAALEKLGYGKPQADSKHSSFKASGLPFPVIIPQRRPKTKTRGFVRAYAPVLQDVGIERDHFLNFIKDLHKHAQASPIFNVIRLGTKIAGIFPEPTVFATAMAVQILNEVGREAHERWRTNKFLEEANRDIFMPRGLYALIVTWSQGGDPEGIESETVDIGAMGAAKFPSSRGLQRDEATEPKSTLDEAKSKVERLRISSAATTESQMPLLCAELMFPALDATQDASESKHGEMQRGMIDGLRSKSKSSAKFVNDYFDRRAQATYAGANPNAMLTKQNSPAAPQFKSRYANPNDHTNKHFFTLITGGRYKAEPLGAKRRWEKSQRKAAERRAQGLKDKPKKRKLGENVLYLAIVNKPSDAEIEAAKQKLERKKHQ